MNINFDINLETVVTAIIAAVSGSWIFYNFKKSRFQHEKIEIGFAEISYSDEVCLLKITIKIKNEGNGILIPDEDKSILEIKVLKNIISNPSLLNYYTLEDLLNPITFFQIESYEKSKNYLIEPDVRDYIDILVSVKINNPLLLKLKLVTDKGYTWYRTELFDAKQKLLQK